MTYTFSNKSENILSAWIALEVLSPQTFQKPEDFAGANGSIAKLDKPLLPWEGEGEKSKLHYKLYYQIVLGTINFPAAIEAILNVYSDKRIERPTAKGEAILAIVTVDNKGRPVDEAAVTLSSFAWGFPQALKGDLSKLSDWTNAEKAINIALSKLLIQSDEQKNILPLNRTIIKTATDYLIKHLGLPSTYITGNSFAVRCYEYFKSPDPPDPLLLNSFFINDLLTAHMAFKAGLATANLKRYVGVTWPTSRKDLLHDRNALQATIAPAQMPAARWPGLGRHPLVLLQQAAVNCAFSELAETGVIAVNGPPGTGKTTLLRDMVAGIVSARAEIMCTFDDPQDAFTNSGEKMPAGSGWWSLYSVDSRIKGFEILITSSNNKAVENVSAELPGLGAIADDIPELRYFSSLASKLLDRPSWGLIAAVLGNAINRNKFRQTFYWDKELGFSTYLAEAAGTPQFIEEVNEKTGQRLERVPQIIAEEDPPRSHEEAIRRWKAAKLEFKQALTASQTCLEKLEDIYQKTIQIAQLKVESQDLRQQVARLKEDTARCQFELESLHAAQAQAESQHMEAEAKATKHRRLKPGLLAFIFKRTQLRQWKQINSIIRQEVVTATQNLENRAKLVVSNQLSLEQLQKSLGATERKSDAVDTKCAQLEFAIQVVRVSLGQHFIAGDFFQQSHEQRQIASPWCDEAAQNLRDTVFVKAMRLHKAFIDAAAKPIRHNLGVLMANFGRGIPDDRKQKLIPDLWTSLFLIVPAVSTTFASVERMLGSIAPESLGWLLVDEAGQALPQAAVGALLRTRRAVVVGDPLQIEPVVTLPGMLTQNICTKFGVDPNRFNAPEASVQTLADAATPYYAEFETKFGSRTVGVPLLVHRRCEEPMFGVSNAIAYERLMVKAKKPGVSSIRNLIGPSRWIDVRGQAFEKWCPEEGAEVIKILQQLKAAYIKPDIYIVSPFVIVADNLRKLIRETGVLTGWVENDYQWPYERIGTVHTVQGREAEAVIFVLGAPNSQQSGARGWAGGRPNLLNVAITRAKEVVYIVGNKELWREAGLFSELSDRL